MMAFWIVICTLNLFAAIVLAGTWQSVVSLVFFGISLYYILKNSPA